MIFQQPPPAPSQRQNQRILLYLTTSLPKSPTEWSMFQLRLGRESELYSLIKTSQKQNGVNITSESSQKTVFPLLQEWPLQHLAIHAQSHASTSFLVEFSTMYNFHFWLEVAQVVLQDLCSEVLFYGKEFNKSILVVKVVLFALESKVSSCNK